MSAKRGRPNDPDARRRVRPHKVGNYTYASTILVHEDPDTGAKSTRYTHWGKVDEHGKFHPNAKYLYLPVEERRQLVFPESWDLSEVAALPSERKAGRPPCTEDSCRFYGDIWLLEQIAEQTKVTQDLEVAFAGHKEMVWDILTLAMFSYLSKLPFSHMKEWQRLGRFPAVHTLELSTITELCKSITETERQRFLQLRAGRCEKDELAAVDSTTRRAYGRCLAEIKWGKNKDDGLTVPQTVEVIVYSLTRHEPVYYLSFSGNMADTVTLPFILERLRRAGFDDLIIITDRGYECPRSLDYCIVKGWKLLTAANVRKKFILSEIDAFGAFGAAPPTMNWIADKKVFAKQYEIAKTLTGRGGCTIRSKDLRLNLYFDPVRRANDLIRLEDEIAEQQENLAALQSAESALPANKLKNYRFFRVRRNKDTNVVEGFERNEKKIQLVSRTFGFFAIITHKLRYTPEYALTVYGLRDEQEKCFMRKKSQEEANLQKCSNDLSREGCLFIEFVGMILVSRLSCVWSSSEKLREHFRTVFSMVEELLPIRCIEQPHRQKLITPFLRKQALICEAFHIAVPKGCEPRYETPSDSTPLRKRGRPRKKKAPKDRS